MLAPVTCNCYFNRYLKLLKSQLQYTYRDLLYRKLSTSFYIVLCCSTITMDGLMECNSKTHRPMNCHSCRHHFFKGYLMIAFSWSVSTILSFFFSFSFLFSTSLRTRANKMTERKENNPFQTSDLLLPLSTSKLTPGSHMLKRIVEGAVRAGHERKEKNMPT